MCSRLRRFSQITLTKIELLPRIIFGITYSAYGQITVEKLQKTFEDKLLPEEKDIDKK
jgi:hypothetical protein